MESDKKRCLRQRSSSAKVIQAIEVCTTAGNGSQENPYRRIIEYWSLDGVLLAVMDPAAPFDVSTVEKSWQ